MRRSRRERKAGKTGPPAPVSADRTLPPGASLSLPPSAGLPGFSYLTGEQIEMFRERALTLLEKHGISIEHEAAVQTLREAGASMATDGKRVTLPRALVEKALAETPKTVNLRGKTPEWDRPLPLAGGGFIMRTGTGAHGFIDPENGNYRKLLLEDVSVIASVGSHLDQVGFIAHPFVNGVPERTSDIHGFAELITRTPKHVWIQPYDTENVEYLMKIAVIAAGGETRLRERPLASCIACSFTPFEFKRMDVEAIIQASRHGLPIHACSLPTAGGTAPVTMPGVALMAAVEILAMVVLTQIVGAGTAVIATPLIFTLDMRSGRSLQSSVEALQGASMSLQLLKRGFGLLTHSYGSGSDTPDVDVQSQAERALLGQLVSLSGTDILGGVGQLECATVFSPVQAILDNEIGRMLQWYLRTPELNDESFAWELVNEVQPGGNFLANEHTLKHCRGTLDPRVFMRQARDTYESSGRTGALENARAGYRAILEQDPLPGLPDADAVREIEAVVKAADEHILD